MKILHVIPSLSAHDGGPSQAAIGMCRALENAGVDTMIATTDSDGAGRIEVELGVESRFEGVRALFFRLDFGVGFKYSRMLASWLNQHVREFDLVHIHAVFNHSSISAARACRKAGVPYVLRPAGTLDPWSLQRSWLRKWLFLKLIGRRMLGGAAQLHFTTESERTRTLADIGEYPSFVLPLGVTFESSSANRDGKPEIESPYVLFLSRIAAKKNIPVLIEAFAKAMGRITDGAGVMNHAPTRPPSARSQPLVGAQFIAPGKSISAWSLVIAGDGEASDLEALKELATRLGIASRIVFTGWLDGKRKQEILANASLFVLPSLHENFGVAVAEAMAAGVPVLVSPGVALAEEAERAGAGWVVEPTAARLAEKLRAILTDSSELARRGSAGRKFAEENFGWDRIAEQLIEQYRILAPFPSPQLVERGVAPKPWRRRTG